MSVEPIKGKNSKWGCYFNRDDPRIWVYRHEKYKAVGVTLNFAKAVSWAWLVVFIALMLVGMGGAEWLRCSSLITSFDRVVRDAIYDCLRCVVPVDVRGLFLAGCARLEALPGAAEREAEQVK